MFDCLELQRYAVDLLLCLQLLNYLTVTHALVLLLVLPINFAAVILLMGNSWSIVVMVQWFY